jgi:GH15 family glucan-1,4-alpha-glucosidase
VQLVLGCGGVAVVGVALDQLFHSRCEWVIVVGNGFGGHPAEVGGDLAKGGGVGSGGPCSGGLDLAHSDLECDGNILRRGDGRGGRGRIRGVGVGRGGAGGIAWARLGGEALAQVVAPGIEVIDPGAEREAPGADAVDGEGGGPHVIGERVHGFDLPAGIALVFVEELGSYVVVAVGEDGCGDVDAIAEEAAGGIAAAIDLGLDVFNDDALASFDWFHKGECTCSGRFDVGTERNVENLTDASYGRRAVIGVPGPESIPEGDGRRVLESQQGRCMERSTSKPVAPVRQLRAKPGSGPSKTGRSGGGARQGRPQQAKSETKAPLHGKRIEDYAFIGDCETGALVARDGSIDWLCWPTFSSGACFAALLGTVDDGYWRIAPKGKVKVSRRSYREGTLIVETVFETSTGEVCVTDFMPPRERHSQLVRMVRGERGRVAMHMDLSIRFDYGRTVPWVTSEEKDGRCELRAVAGPDMVVLNTSVALKGVDHRTVSDFTVAEGETVCFTLTYCSSLEKPPRADAEDRLLRKTETFWTSWGKKAKYTGQYREAVMRSLVTLKALTYRPTGGVVAAVTTSLPEEIGGSRNWDYRYCWLRDTSFTLLVLLHAGYHEEAVAWRRWLLRAVAGAPDQVQTIYGIWGERDLVEWEAAWLPGYEHSLPVRIGNDAVGQFQLDVYGEVASALGRMPEAEEDIRMPSWDVQVEMANHLCEVWKLPDEGIWEVRGGPKHFVYSKVMAWVALDRTIEVYEREGKTMSASARRKGMQNVNHWRRVRAEIHAEVCKKGFDRKLNSFVQAYGPGSTPGALDASCLRIGLVGFLPPDDPRVVGTVEAIQQGLNQGGFVQRYKTGETDDGLSGSEGEFLACSFWMVASLWLIGRKDEATELFERLLTLCNDVGLLSEEYDSHSGRLVGNFPQALSHIALLHAAYTMSGEWRPDHFAD